MNVRKNSSIIIDLYEVNEENYHFIVELLDKCEFIWEIQFKEYLKIQSDDIYELVLSKILKYYPNIYDGYIDRSYKDSTKLNYFCNTLTVDKFIQVYPIIEEIFMRNIDLQDQYFDNIIIHDLFYNNYETEDLQKLLQFFIDKGLTKYLLKTNNRRNNAFDICFYKNINIFDIMIKNNISIDGNINKTNIISWIQQQDIKLIMNIICQSKYKNQIYEIILSTKRNISCYSYSEEDSKKILNKFKLIQELKDSSVKSATE